MFRKAVRNDIHKECIKRKKNQAQAEINETETTTSIKSINKMKSWFIEKIKTTRLTIFSQINQMKKREEEK